MYKRQVEIRSIDNLEQFIVDNEVQIAALTIPKSKAPEIADRLVRAGIKAIWNFAHTDLNVPDDVVAVSYTHLDVYKRQGLEDGHPRTLEEVGKEFNVTRERIRQIEAKALRKLRNPVRSKRIRDFL